MARAKLLLPEIKNQFQKAAAMRAKYALGNKDAR
jgi:hypothetical protein